MFVKAISPDVFPSLKNLFYLRVKKSLILHIGTNMALGSLFSNGKKCHPIILGQRNFWKHVQPWGDDLTSKRCFSTNNFLLKILGCSSNRFFSKIEQLNLRNPVLILNFGTVCLHPVIGYSPRSLLRPVFSVFLESLVEFKLQNAEDHILPTFSGIKVSNTPILQTE